MITDKQIEKIENSAARLTIEVSGDATQSYYNKVVEKFEKQAQIPGFRKGKVPRSLLVRKFAAGMKEEATSNLIKDASEQALKEVEENPLSLPHLTEFQAMNPGDSYKFFIVFDVFPEITLGDYKGLTVEAPEVSILKKHVDMELEKIRLYNSVFVEKEDGIIEDDSNVTMDFAELGENDELLKDSERSGFAFTMNNHSHPYGIEDDITGLKTGEEKIITKTFTNEAPPDLAGRTVKLKVKINAVKRRQLPDLDDELAQDVSDDLHTLADLKNRVKSNLKKNADEMIRSKKIMAIRKQLIDSSAISLPESMIESEIENTWNEYIRQTDLSEEEFLKYLEKNGRSKAEFTSQWREDAIDSVKVRLIYGRIIELEKLDVNDEELLDAIKQEADNMKIDVEEYKKKIGNKQIEEYLKKQLITRKLIEFLLTESTVVKDGKIDYSELLSS